MISKTPKPANAPNPKAARDNLVRELAALLEETGLNEIEVEQNGMRVRVARGGGATMHMAPDPGAPARTLPAATPTPAAPAAPHPGTVNSPMVGTAYVGPQPGAAPFVKVGDEVKEGQTIVIIEAMKTMNPVAATVSGRIADIQVSDAQPVEFGQVLMLIE